MNRSCAGTPGKGAYCTEALQFDALCSDVYPRLCNMFIVKLLWPFEMQFIRALDSLAWLSRPHDTQAVLRVHPGTHQQTHHCSVCLTLTLGRSNIDGGLQMDVLSNHAL